MSVNRIKESMPGQGFVTLTWKEYCKLTQLRWYSYERKYFFGPVQHFWCGTEIKINELFDNFKRVRGAPEILQEILAKVEC